MSKLKVLSGKDVCKIMEKYDFVEIRRHGSHIVMQKKLKSTTITVIVPDHKETLMSIIRQSGIPREEFEG